MKKYLVGGCVRDELLGLLINDRDWVVVGSSPEEMLNQGYKAVGKDFPVFLHPETKEEYALARTERKTAPGYTGFVFHAAPDVSLEQDLARRDLTINAMAKSESGEIVDPYNGQADLDARVLRHVSPAFSEDPLRILRVARFAARFASLGFKVARDTLGLMQEMVSCGEVNALVPERVWQETQCALGEAKPSVYFEVLRECGALKVLFPEVDALYGVPQTEKYHPEIDTGIHTMMVIDQAAVISKKDPQVCFAALVHDLGKGVTPKSEWPKHVAHEVRGLPLVKAMSKRLKIPKDYSDLALLVTEHHLLYHRAAELRASTFVRLFGKLDAFRRPERFEKFVLTCESDSRGRQGHEEMQPEQTEIFNKTYKVAAAINASELVRQGLEGKAIGEALEKLRCEAIGKIKNEE
ncbi:MAG: multifunctional CCA addition/repair protein [Gammaproteobacteria bacterium]|nr:multifunctional CCA addition/repair protein [Gammaproteobacteria bacterium]